MSRQCFVLGLAALAGSAFTPAASAADPDCGLLSYGSGIDASTDCVVLSTAASSFNGLLRDEGSEVGVILMHGRNTAFDGSPMVHHPNAVVVKQLRTQLSGLGYSTLSIETPDLPLAADRNGNNRADFFEYAANEDALTADVFGRINAAIDELAARSVNRIVLAGFSMGSRYATAATAAAQLGLLGNSRDIVGLIGAGMVSSLAGSTPTTGAPASVADINGYDTLGNLRFVDLPVLDVYGDLDSNAATTAAARRAAYAGTLAGYTQLSLTCPDFTRQPYYFKRNGAVTLANTYTENRCHQLRNGYTYDAGAGTFSFDAGLVGNPDRPLELGVTNWMAVNNGFAATTTATVPAPSGAMLLVAGLLGWRRLAR